MKNTNVNKLPKFRLIAIATAAAAISACGGGGGGGSRFPILPIAPPAEQPPAPVADTSAPCFNEADFREGTAVEFEALKTKSNTTSQPVLRKSVTGGREVFAGANPVAFNVGAETRDGDLWRQATVKKEYKDFVAGNMLLYGKSATDAITTTQKYAELYPTSLPLEYVISESQTYEPPFSFPVDMKAGQVASQKSSVTKTKVFNGRGDPAISIPATGELTYHGREKLETPLGTFDTCKLSLKITVGASVISKDATKEFWLAAEGPYRGQLLKGVDPKSSTLVTKMTYSPK